MNVPNFIERRRAPRTKLTKLCKVRDRRTARFVAGETTDLSDTGALIRIDRGRPFGPGDEIDIVVAMNNEALVPSERFVRARIRRVMPIDHHHQAIALQFVEEAESQLLAA